MKLSAIEKILLVAIAVVVIASFNLKHTSHLNKKPVQAESIKVEDLGLTVAEFRRAYEELI